MESTNYLGFVLYYGRQKLYYDMQKFAVDGLLKFPEERIYALLNGFALVLGDRKVDAARVLSGLKIELDLSLATLLALNFNLEEGSLKNQENFSVLENYFKNDENNFNLKANAFYYAALFYYFIEDYKNAEKFIDDVLEFKSKHEPSLILKAWIQLRDFSRMNKIPFAVEFVLKQDPGRHIDATLCKVQYLQLMNEFDKGINQLNMISIRYPEISIPLLEKLRIQLTTCSWEQAQETTMRIINLEPQNIMALCTKALLLLCRENNFKLTMHVLKHLFTATDVIEHGNHIALLRICQLFARMCSRNTDVLKLILHTLNKLVRDYVHTTTANVDYLNEIAQQWLMLYNYKEAYGCFQAVLGFERNNFLALCGLTQCQFMENPNNIMAIKQQIEFISTLDGNVHRTSGYLLLCAKTQQREEALPLLIEAAELQMITLKKFAFGIEYMHQLNPDLLIELSMQFLLIGPAHFMYNQQFVVSIDTFHITIKHSLCILEGLLRVCPTHLHANFLRAVVHLLCGEYLHALQVLKNLTDKEEDFSCFIDAQLLLAHIHIQQEQYGKAKEALDKALASDFMVREYAIYHLLMGKIQRHQEQFTEAKKSFITAFHIVGNKTASSTTTANINTVHFSGLFNLKTDKGKIMLYLQLIYTLRDLTDFTGSEHYMQNAMEEFYGTPEEGQLLIAQAKIFLKDFHYTKALNLLNSIESDQPYYLQSKTLLADIYLKHCKNRVLFAKCYKEIVKLRPQMDSLLMLGEAYLTIQEPELAIETYRNAFKWSPDYILLASKLGHAYVKTHQYNKAIEHYQMVLAHANNKTIKIDLTALYLLLKQYKNAENTLSCDLETRNSQIDDDLDLEIRTRELLLLSHTHEKLNNIPLALKVLKIALSLQKNATHANFVSHIQQQSIARIYLLLAQLNTRIGSLPQAETYYQECLKYCSAGANVKVFLGLAQLYMQMNSMELCSNICKQLLQFEPKNQDASVMLADILFRKMEFTKAVQHFSVLLRNQPHYWTALVRLIQIMHRLDKISHACEFLERAEQLLTGGNKKNPGLIYCQALYNWYTSKLHVALQLFNNVRRDIEWGQQATSNMIEIYLNFDENIHYVYGNDTYNFNDIQHNAVNVTALATAESLLKEFRPKLDQADIETYNLILLENLLHIASNQQQRIKLALQNFKDMHSCNQYQNKVGLVFGTALAYMKLKEDICQAKSLLKNIIHTSWSFEESGYLERCWLLCAYIYLQENKLESALHFLELILKVNKSHIKANELAGFITEKCEMYAESINYYLKAWYLCEKAKPYIGYKLAYCYMKLKRNADALNVCQQVLKLHPDFHVIEKDILHKCRFNLRT